MAQILEVSELGHTWIMDLDGTVVKHNGYKTDKTDVFLDGAKEFLDKIPAKDMVIFITSREECRRAETVSFLENYNIRYDAIIFGAPLGERIVINDIKPGGLKTALSINVDRDADLHIEVRENHML